MKQPIRILHIVGVMDQAGIEILLMNLYRNIDRSVIQFDFLTHSRKKGFFDDEIMSLGGKIYSVVNPFSAVGMFQYPKALSDFFKGHPEYTMVHSHMNTFSGMILSIAKKSGVETCIAHSHATLIENPIKKPIGHISKLFGQNSITHFFACSKDAAKWAFGKQANKTIIFKNAIDLSLYQFSNKTRSEYRKKLTLEDKYVIGHTGRFAYQKNHGKIVDVFYEVHKQLPESRLLLVGDGSTMDDIKQKAKELGVFDYIIFTGARNDVSNLLQAMDIFLLPSFFEGFCISLLEAQSVGLPCVTSNIIPQEVQVTDLIAKLDLKENDKIWADKILSYRNFTRKSYHENIEESGYSIHENTKWLTEFYLNSSNN